MRIIRQEMQLSELLLSFTVIANSAWNLNTTWSYTSGGAAVPAGAVEGVNFPGPNSIVIIENNHTVNLKQVLKDVQVC